MTPLLPRAAILTAALTLTLTLTLTGCESAPTADQVVPIAEIPPSLMEKARKELPGINFDTAYKMKVNGADAYEIRGKNAQGKTREIEISTTGEVLEIE